MLFGKVIEPNSAAYKNDTDDASNNIRVVTHKIHPLNGESCKVDHTEGEGNGKAPHVRRIEQKGQQGFAA
jgi:hypothetical protein